MWSLSVCTGLLVTSKSECEEPGENVEQMFLHSLRNTKSDFERSISVGWNCYLMDLKVSFFANLFVVNCQVNGLLSRPGLGAVGTWLH